MQEIFIGNAKRPIRFSFGALKKMRKLAKEQSIEITEETEDLDIVHLQVFVGLEAAAKKLGQKFDHSIIEVELWVDDLEINEVMAINEIITKEITGHLPKADGSKN